MADVSEENSKPTWPGAALAPGPDVLLPRRPVIAVIGAGALGAYYGARLAQHGHTVHFLFRRDVEAVRRAGLRVQSVTGDFSLSADAITVHGDVRGMPKADLVLIGLKTVSNDAYAPLIAPLLNHNTALLTLQNGLSNEETLAGLFGAGRVMGGVAYVGLNRVAPGVIHHLGNGLIRLGEFSAAAGDRAEHVAAMFRECAVPCEVVASLPALRWDKLLWNIPFNGLGAALGLSGDQIVASPGGRALVGALIAETMAAARAEGVTFPIPTEAMIARQIGVTEALGPYRSSMQIDREEGRPLEVEAILGEPLRRARARGIPTPHLAMLYEQAKLVDPGRRA